jgi:hypothetical protein
MTDYSPDSPPDPDADDAQDIEAGPWTAAEVVSGVAEGTIKSRERADWPLIACGGRDDLC